MIAPVLLTVLSLPTSPSLPAPSMAGAKDGPPGLVMIKGGRTPVGSTKEDVAKMIESNEVMARVFDAERPQNKIRIDDFYFMVTEVTNEQYKAFVDATGYRAPRSWAGAAIEEARKAFLKAEGDRRVAAREEGKTFQRREFDIDGWWEKNYESAAWEMPAEEALHPVSYVSYEDALAYCAWAGLRLPTEAEFQRAVRGDKDHLYPWGEEWKEGAAATAEMKNLQNPMKVASFEDGVSRDGLYDLAGNVWEWTSSPYQPYEGFKAEKYKLGKGKNKKEIEVEFHKWDANQRVSVGGSFQNQNIAARATTRRETDRSQRTNALGFRCAASPRVGIDIARSVWELEARTSDARAQETEYSPETALVIDRWDMAESSKDDAPENYAIISGYDYVMWLPTSNLQFSDMGKMSRASRTEPVQLGLLSTSIPVVEPELPAGSYFISYRGKGREIEAEEKEEKKGPRAQDEGEATEEGVEVDTRDENLLIHDASTGALVLTIEVKETQTVGALNMKFEKVKDAGSIEIVDEKVWQKPAAEDAEPVQVVEKHIRLKAQTPSNVARRSLVLQLQLKPDQVRVDKDGWRKP